MELEVLGDRYELAEPIGRGGMATIYRAVDLRMGRTVAAKILREVYSSDPKFVTRFQREARAASALQHPNIVQVFDYGQSGESYYIVMEFVEGADLRRYLKKHGVLDNERAIEIAHDVALGLGAAHKRGIVHRDVKPQNIMLNDSGLVKLTDFGIASMYKDAEAERLTTTGMTLGTVQYYAPEQAQGEIVSPAADIYALGIVMYEMLAGRTPFDGDTPVAVAMRHIQDVPEPPSTYNPRIAPGLERIVLRCLEKDPRDRYRDGDALAYALENLGRTGRRATGIGAPSNRAQFAPLTLPSTDGRPMPGAGPAAYGAPAIASGPRGGSRIPSQPGGGRPGGYGGFDAETVQGFGSAPTYDDYGGPPGLATRPNGPAAGTVPRSPSAGRVSGPYGLPQGPDGKQRNGPIVAAVVGAALLLLALSCFLVLVLTDAGSGLAGIFGGPTPSPTVVLIKMPDFRGMQYAKALAQAQSKQLQVTQNLVPSDKPKGEVVDQTPPPDSPVPVNSSITLNVSNGPDKVPVPDLVGKSRQYAIDTLTAAKFVPNIVYQPDPVVAFDSVIKTTPPAGQALAPGSTVTVYVSTGQPTATPTKPAPTATATATAVATTCTPGPGCP
jgi:eukaryotic-like serine/threonine-protein kinase